MNTKTELLAQHAKLMLEAETLGKQIKAMDEVDTWPQPTNAIYLLYASGYIEVESYYTGRSRLADSLVTGSAFRTRKEAEKELARRKVMVKLKALTKGYVPNWGDTLTTKYIIFYNHSNKYWDACGYGSLQTSFLPIFANRQDAKHAIDTLGSELDALL